MMDGGTSAAIAGKPRRTSALATSVYIIAPMSGSAPRRYSRAKIGVTMNDRQELKWWEVKDGGGNRLLQSPEWDRLDEEMARKAGESGAIGQPRS